MSIHKDEEFMAEVFRSMQTKFKGKYNIALLCGVIGEDRYLTSINGQELDILMMLISTIKDLMKDAFDCKIDSQASLFLLELSKMIFEKSDKNKTNEKVH